TEKENCHFGNPGPLRSGCKAAADTDSLAWGVDQAWTTGFGIYSSSRCRSKEPVLGANSGRGRSNNICQKSFGQMDHLPGQPIDPLRNCEPSLVSPLWHGHCTNTRKLRRLRRETDKQGAAGLAGIIIHPNTQVSQLPNIDSLVPQIPPPP